MVNEVATQEERAVANPNSVEAWGPSSISAKDILIPRILLMQPMSEKVTAGEAAFGEFRNSLDNSKMGDFKTPLEIIPICMKKNWVEYDVTAGDDYKNKKFLRAVPVTPANESLPYKDSEQNGALKISRDLCMDFYVLLPSEIALGGAIPYVLTFRRSSLTAGKVLITQMEVKNKMAGKSPASVICTVSAGKETNDAGTFAVMSVTPSKPTPEASADEALKWFKVINLGQAKVSEEYHADDVTPGEVKEAKGPANF
jgi:hypothetical protein